MIDIGIDPGLDMAFIDQISRSKGEPDWLRDLRLRSHGILHSAVLGACGADTRSVHVARSDIEAALGIDHKLDTRWRAGESGAGVTARNESDEIDRVNREALEKQGVVFTDMDTAVKDYPEIVRSYLGTIVLAESSRFAALNSAVWSGGMFVYVPPGVVVELPLQDSISAGARTMGQFARTLIIADKGAEVQCIEGCMAPVYSSGRVRSTVVELVALDHSRVTYTAIQNWSPNVSNVVSGGAVAHEGAHAGWIEANIGSRFTRTHPTVHLVGPGASGEVLSVAYAGAGQHQDTGATIVHAAPGTTSGIVSKAVGNDGGRTTHVAHVRVENDDTGCAGHVQSDALVLDDLSICEISHPTEPASDDGVVCREAALSEVTEHQRFYLRSRGLTDEQAMAVIVNGFFEPVARKLPMEYAVEWSRLIELQIGGSIG